MQNQLKEKEEEIEELSMRLLKVLNKLFVPNTGTIKKKIKRNHIRKIQFAFVCLKRRIKTLLLLIYIERS